MNPTHWPWPSNIRRIHKSRYRVRVERLTGEVAAAIAWRVAAASDGWEFQPTYSHESLEQAFRGMRDGMIVLGLARLGGDLLPSGDINAWCNKGISLNPVPVIYPGFAALKALARHCPECGANDVATGRVAFANRACARCAPDLRKKLERPGWCD